MEVLISARNVPHSMKLANMINRALRRKRVPTFKDRFRLREEQQGTNLDERLMEAIAMSKICIVLLSKDYVSSTWCLEELAVIMQCRKQWGLIVLPVFYEMDPSYIKEPTGEVFVNDKSKGGVLWGMFKEVANLDGRVQLDGIIDVDYMPSQLRESADLCGCESHYCDCDEGYVPSQLRESAGLFGYESYHCDWFEPHERVSKLVEDIVKIAKRSDDESSCQKNARID